MFCTSHLTYKDINKHYMKLSIRLHQKIWVHGSRKLPTVNWLNSLWDQIMNVVGYKSNVKELFPINTYKECTMKLLYRTSLCLLFQQELQGKGNQISAAGTSLTDVGMLVEDTTRDVLFLLPTQHIRLILFLLLRLKEASIQLALQGNRWAIDSNIGAELHCVGDGCCNFSCSAIIARAFWVGFFIWLPRYPWQFGASQWHCTFSPKCTNLSKRQANYCCSKQRW